MNYIKHLNQIWYLFDQDPGITIYHICLYTALFRSWNHRGFQNPLIISRDLIMEKSKIGSTRTYSKTLTELSDWGYLKYEKSTSKTKGSEIIMFTSWCKSKHDVHPLNKLRNYYIYKDKKYQNFSESQDFNPKKLQENENINSVTPSLDHIKIYFDEKGVDQIEAEKFFNHYEALGWVNSSQVPIINWKASARNWIINIPKFNPKPKFATKQTRPKPTEQNHKPGSTHINPNKDYDTPL